MDLNNRTQEDILKRRSPMKELLEGSVYCPACYTDGTPVPKASEAQTLGIHMNVACKLLGSCGTHI